MKTAHAQPTPTQLAEYSAYLNDENRVYAHSYPHGGTVRRLVAQEIRLRRWAWREWGAGRLTLYAVRIIVGDPPARGFRLPAA